MTTPNASLHGGEPHEGLSIGPSEHKVPTQSEIAELERLLEADHMREALERCREQFLSYADQHHAKATAEGDHKARVNLDMMELCAQALAKTPPARTGWADREAVARVVGSFVVSGDTLGDDVEVIHDQFPGGYDQRTARVYALTDAILALPIKPPKQEGWRPIAEAPRDDPINRWLLTDGKHFVIGGRSFVSTGERTKAGFWTTQTNSGWNPKFKFVPTHFMPLPAPPALPNGEEG